MATSQPGRNWAVAIVHGIGSTEPVDMLQRVTKAIGSACRDITFSNQINIEIDPNADPAQRRHEQHATDGFLPDGSRVRFATALWSDIGVVSEGLLSLLAGVLLGGFGVRYFAEVGSSTGELPARALHRVLQAMIWLLALVILPVTMCLAIFSSVALIAAQMVLNSLLWLQTPIICVVSLSLVYVIWSFGHKYLEKSAVERKLIKPVLNVFLGIAVVECVLLLITQQDIKGAPFKLGLLGLDNPISQVVSKGIVGLGWLLQHDNWVERAKELDPTGLYIGLLYSVQDLGGLVEIILAFVVLVLLVITYLDPRVDRSTARSLLLSSVCVVSMWTMMLLLLWPEKIITSMAMTHYSSFKPGVEHTFQLAAACIDFQKMEFCSEKTYIPANYYQALWFDWVFLAFLLLTLVVVGVLVMFRSIAARARRNFDPEKFKPEGGVKATGSTCWPRLVVSWGYVALVLALMIVTVVVVAFELFGPRDTARALFKSGSAIEKFPHEVIINYSYMIPAVLLSIFGFLVVASSIRDSVKLMLDVVNHFVAPDKAFPVRREIAQRLVDTLDYLTRDGDKPHLVIIAHSQGTVITLDTIFGSLERADVRGAADPMRQSGVWTGMPAGWNQQCLQDRVSSLTILTFGSPVTNVYQHYFGHMYQPFVDTAKIAAMAKDPRVKWFNTYRIDDYVGTWIDNSIASFPVNMPMPNGGHIKYWEAEIFKPLFDQPGLRDVLGGRARV